MYTCSRRLRVAAAAGAVALLMAGCASDDEPVSSPSEATTASASPTPTAASVEDFCAAKIAIDATDLAPPEEGEEGGEESTATPSAEEIAQKKADLDAKYTDVYNDLDATKQATVAGEVDTLVKLVRAGVAAGDDSFGEDEAFGAAEAQIDEYLLDACGFEAVKATATNYEYAGLPASIPAGPTSLTLTNDGDEMHEMVVLRINDDSLDAEGLVALGTPDKILAKATFAGIAFSPPGQTTTGFFDLAAGRYAIVCFIPKDTDAEHNFQGEGPPHFTEGMLEELTVLAPGEVAPEPTSTSDPDSGSGTGSEESAAPTSSTSSSSTAEDEESEETSSPEPSSSS